MESDRLRRLMLVVAPPLLFTTPVVEFLGAHSIPIFARPSLAILGGLAALGALMGCVAAILLPHIRSGRPRQLAFVAAIVAIVFVGLDAAVGGQKMLTALLPPSAEMPVLVRRLLRLVVVAAAGTAALGLVWPVRRRVPAVLALCSVAFFTSTLTLHVRALFPQSAIPSPPPASVPATDQPIVVYIVLDEAMGVEGLKSAPDGQSLADEIRALAARHGFRLHGGAFSRHFVSVRSIPDVLNFDTQDDAHGQDLVHANGTKVESRLFQRLAAARYEIVSYGTTHIDFCFHDAARCEIMPSFNPYTPYIGDDSTSPLTDSHNAERKALVVYHFVGQRFIESYVLNHYVALLASRHPTALPADFYSIDAYEFPQWFARFAADVTASPRGRAYFAHFLMPHTPYVFDAGCRETGEASIGYGLTEQRQITGDALERERARIYADYLQQYRCALRELDRLLTRLDVAPRFADATIVVQGDHGARISAGMYAETLSDRDMIDNYSALFMIRRPGVAADYDVRKTSVQRLAAEYFSGQQAAALGPDNPTVAIDSSEGRGVVVRPMPDFGDARTD